MARSWLPVMMAVVNADSPRCSPPIPGVIVGINENVRMFPNITSVPLCCSLCAATDRCVAFNVHNNACRLHNQSVPVKNASNSISGKLLDAPGKSCATRQGVVFGAGHNLGGHKTVVAPEACCAACRANKACKAWNYHPNTKICYLHPQISPMRSDRSSISGVPAGVLPPLPPQPGQYTTGYACTASDAANKVRNGRREGRACESKNFPRNIILGANRLM